MVNVQVRKEDEFSSAITIKDLFRVLHSTEFHCCILVHVVFEYVFVTRPPLASSSAATLEKKKKKKEKGHNLKLCIDKYGTDVDENVQP